MKTEKIIVKVQETSRRTIEFDCEILVPIDILESKDEDLLDEFVQNRINEKELVRYHFVDIVESDVLNTEIIETRKGKLPLKINSKYIIEL